MSHASVLIALPPTTTEVVAAVDYEMEPFDENGHWFKDGSRWDWYVIGGRYTGSLDGYDPDADPRNWERCRYCHGTGKREDMEVPNGCNACYGTGTARVLTNAPHKGDVLRKKDIDLTALAEAQKTSLLRTYERAQQCDRTAKEFIYGVKEGETLDEFMDRHSAAASITHHAFLRNRHWHEAERMGFFGGSRASECERNAPGGSESISIEDMLRRCKWNDEETGASIVVWNEPYEIWNREFYRRFVEPLSDDSILVTVDYHV